ncbi:MAG: type II toxin-antitoxin system VapC family toxin [Deltaproteobacteria bacterium]
MITAVDTNVLLDVFFDDPKFGRGSAEALRKCLGEGALAACEVVWAETASMFGSESSFLEAMETLTVGFSPVRDETALRAASAWRKYRSPGGKRTRVVADFLVGSHAVTQCDRLLTRDRGFYRTYFSGLRVLDPSAAG